MSFFRKKRADPLMKAVADGMERGKSDTYKRLRVERPEMADAIDRIESAQTLEQLDLALQDLCDSYDPLFQAIVSEGGEDQLSKLLFYGSVWFDPAMKKCDEIIRVNTGNTLKPGALLDRMFEIEKRDTPGQTIEAELPPRAKCRYMILATQTYL